MRVVEPFNKIEEFRGIADFHLRQLRIAKNQVSLENPSTVENFKDSFAEAFGFLWTASKGNLPQTITLKDISSDSVDEEISLNYDENKRVVLEGVVVDGFIRRSSFGELSEIQRLATRLLNQTLQTFELELLENLNQ